MHYRVIDEQTRLGAGPQWFYSQVVRVVDSTAGLSAASTIEAGFNPGYQRFVLHHLRVNRNGKAIDKADDKHVQLLQRETQLERRLYDGRITFHIVLDDVRVGDEVDFAYSIVGANPVFGGRLTQLSFMAAERGPVAAYRVRLLTPSDRTIAQRIGPKDAESQTRELGSERETVITRKGIARFEPEQGAPYGSFLAESVQFSEFSDWAAVSRWGASLFAASEGGERTGALAREIAASTPDPEQRVLAALAFVQGQVRYLGIELGANSHRPAAPDQVIEQRHGDCKDKVALLVALLRRMDIPAVPVLVSLGLRDEVQRMQAAPHAFDHVIARIDLPGGPYFVDATLAQQRGPLSRRMAVDFQAGLPLAPDTRDLAELPKPFDTVRQVVEDEIHVRDFAADPELEARMTFRGNWAAAVREAVATRGAELIQTQMSSPYFRIYPKAQSLGPMQVTELDDDDAVRLTLRFRLGDFWRFPEERVLTADVAQWSLVDVLTLPRQDVRRDPLGIASPGIYRHVTTLSFDEDVTTKPVTLPYDETQTHFSYSTVFEGQPRMLRYRSELRLRSNEIPPRDWAAHTAKALAAMRRMGANPSVPALSPARLDKLRQELAAFDEALKGRKPPVRTRAQADAYAKVLVLTAQLDSGRLASPLRAQALTSRGIQRDHLGQQGQARLDFDAALQLAEDVPATQSAAAVNALSLRDLARAEALARKVLAKDDRDVEARATVGRARYLQGDASGAAREFQRTVDDAGNTVQRGYGLVWLALSTRRAGADLAPVIAAASADRLPTDWPRPLVDFALGRLTADALLDEAKKGRQAAEQTCEAQYFMGERQDAEGDRRQAKRHWQRALDTGVTEFIEYSLARLRLAE
jgi:lipoprotein NlpI/transglutaminase-like putative cysteine protease